MKRCKACGIEYEDNKTFCKECGAKLESVVSKKYCVNCNLEYPSDRRFCKECGSSLSVQEENNSEKESDVFQDAQEIVAEEKNESSKDDTKEIPPAKKPPGKQKKKKNNVLILSLSILGVIAIAVIVLALIELSGIIHIQKLPPAIPLLAVLIAGFVLYFLYRKNKGDKNEKM